MFNLKAVTADSYWIVAAVAIYYLCAWLLVGDQLGIKMMVETEQ